MLQVINYKKIFNLKFISAFIIVSIMLPSVSYAVPIESTGLMHSNGRAIGIGTPNPDQRLTIKGGGIGFDNNSADKKLYSPADGVLEWVTHDRAAEHGFSVSHQGERRIFLNTNGNSYIKNGNVGIGTNNPREKLDVNGNIVISNSFIPMGFTTEVFGYTPLLNMDVNFRQYYKNNYFRGAAIRIDTRNNIPLFQWLARPAQSYEEKLVMVLTEQGNLGVGATNPDQKLTIKGGGIGFDYNSSDKKLYSPVDGVLEWVTHDAAGEHGFSVSHQGDRRVFLNTNGNSYIKNGNFGIGTTNPKNNLQIGMTSGIFDYNSGFNLLGNLYFKDGWRYTTSNYGTAIQLDSTQGNINFQTADKGVSDTAASPISRLLIKNNGNVGIGTADAKDKLDVAGELRLLTDKNPIRFTSSWSKFPDQAPNQAEISNDIDTYKTLMIVGNSSAGLGRRVSVWDRLEVNGTFTVSDKIGVGTNTPTEKLEVEGNIKSSGTICDKNGCIGSNNNYIKKLEDGSICLGKCD